MGKGLHPTGKMSKNMTASSFCICPYYVQIRGVQCELNAIKGVQCAISETSGHHVKFPKFYMSHNSISPQIL